MPCARAQPGSSPSKPCRRLVCFILLALFVEQQNQRSCTLTHMHCKLSPHKKQTLPVLQLIETVLAARYICRNAKQRTGIYEVHPPSCLAPSLADTSLPQKQVEGLLHVLLQDSWKRQGQGMPQLPCWSSNTLRCVLRSRLLSRSSHLLVCQSYLSLQATAAQCKPGIAMSGAWDTCSNMIPCAGANC